jgi:hypothetical protein
MLSKRVSNAAKTPKGTIALARTPELNITSDAAKGTKTRSGIKIFMVTNSLS